MFIFIKIYIKTYGCNINNFESENLFNNIKYYKILQTKIFFLSNLIFLNSCIIRKNSQIKILKELKKWFFIKTKKKLIIILTGCMVDFENFNKLKKLKIDIIINDISIFYLNKFLFFFFKYKKKIFLIKKKKYFNLKYNNKFILIMKGCNHNCTYCVIPQSKGREIYFSYKYIINSLIKKIKFKLQDITLLGQNVNSYNFGIINFNDLIYNISKIKNYNRINFFSSNLFDFNNDFYYIYKNIKKISSHIHLPIQSGSNYILRQMNRKYKVVKYLKFIKNIKKIKFTTFSTDIILGFPNEKFYDFDFSLKIIKKINFIDIYYFLYSKRKNTISYCFKENEIKIKKFKFFIFNNNIKSNLLIFINKILKAYVIGYINNNIFIGKLDNLKLVFFEYYSYKIIGNFIFVKIIKIFKNIFLGIYK